MKELKFPLLRENQIEVRVGQVSAKGCSLLLYKTSRTDSEILDQVVGVGNWQKKFYTLQGVGMGDKERSIVVCSVGIYDDDKHEWVWKDDSGTESQVEQDKGVCSDAFKRAAGGSCWGVGRELYYTGFIFVKCETKKNDNGRGYSLVNPYKNYEVQKIEWNENPLSLKTLVIVDEDGNVVFSKGSSTKVSKTADLSGQSTNSMYQEEHAPLKDNDKLFLQAYVGNLSGDAYNNFFSWLKQKFGVEKITDLNAAQGVVVVETLKRRNK